MTFGHENLFVFGKFSDFFAWHQRRSKGAQFPGAESLRGAKKFQKCHRHFFQNSTCASERPQVRTCKKHTNREPNSYNHLGAFYVTCFARVWDFYNRGERLAMCWPSRCALKFLCHHTYYIGAGCSFFWTQMRLTDVTLIKKRRPSVLSNISIVAISVGLPVAVNNPVPASQVGFQQFRAI